MSDFPMTHFTPASPRASRAGWGHLAAALMLAWRTYTTRKALPDLTPEQLADIGITRATALAEAARLPWDLRRPSWHRRMAQGFGSGWAMARTRHLVSEPRARGLYDV